MKEEAPTRSLEGSKMSKDPRSNAPRGSDVQTRNGRDYGAVEAVALQGDISDM